MVGSGLGSGTGIVSVGCKNIHDDYLINMHG